MAKRHYLEVLRSEFDGADDSFIIQLRCHLTWDKKAFSRLVRAMKACCEESEKKRTLPRWIANGFFYFPSFTRDWVGHPDFPKSLPADYYERALQRLDDLAYWYFFAESPYEGRHGFGPL